MAEMTAATIVSELRSEIAGFCTENLSDYMQVVRADLLDNAARVIEQQAQEIAKKDRMIDGAINQLCKGLCPIFIAKRCLDQQNPLKSECPPDKCWRKWLEKEAEAQG